MPVEQRAHRVHQRILLVVALHQHRIKRRNRARAELPGALHQPRQPGKDRGRVALGRRRLPGRQTDLARRHGEARQRIEHQQHVLALRRQRTPPSWLPPAPPACASAATGPKSKPRPPSAPGPPRPANLRRNSPTSRPRSPTSPTTVTSASVLRVIMPISVLLPTPDPPKMPTRWPRPTVSMPSMARMPVPSGVADRHSVERRAHRSIQRQRRRYRGRPAPVDRLPQRIQHPPHQRRPHLDLRPARPAPRPDRRSESPPSSPPASRAHSSRETRSPRPDAHGPPDPESRSTRPPKPAAPPTRWSGPPTRAPGRASARAARAPGGQSSVPAAAVTRASRRAILRALHRLPDLRRIPGFGDAPARSKKPRSISPSCERIPRSTVPSSALDHAIAQAHSLARHHRRFHGQIGHSAMASVHKSSSAAGTRSRTSVEPRQLSQRHPHRAGQQQRIHLRLAAQNARGHRQRQLHHLLLHRVQKPVALPGKALDQPGQLPLAPFLLRRAAPQPAPRAPPARPSCRPRSRPASNDLLRLFGQPLVERSAQHRLAPLRASRATRRRAVFRPLPPSRPTPASGGAPGQAGYSKTSTSPPSAVPVCCRSLLQASLPVALRSPSSPSPCSANRLVPSPSVPVFLTPASRRRSRA